ncbi:hypothetical protein HPP92_010127 [Vanilla planifolia]|uniref:Pentatricopeptide repeat-containing protein n=1 Tax=Vanilla planifolia TaxID=51239 RepID=A0A835R8Z4_VANPL|nr:hypothetical protein HPP92_010121 [Vanilla planifolia]KAG0482043.1 hypothetical protein HPP92_010127 [Vanilla planifolia]
MTLFLPTLNRRFLLIPSSQSTTLRLRLFGPPDHFRSCSTDSRNPSDEVLSLLNSCSSLVSIRKAHALLLVTGQSTILRLQTKLLSSYAFLGSTECARLVFDSITDPDLYSWKAMLKGYVMKEKYLESIRLCWHMRGLLEDQDDVVFSLVLKACIRFGDFSEGRKLHCHIIKVGSPDVFLLNVLINLYCKCCDMKSACSILDSIPDRNVVSWTTVITGLVQHNRAKDGLVLFNKMRSARVFPSVYTMSSVLSACSFLYALHQGRWTHCCILKEGMGMNSFVGSALLNMYVKCAEVTDARAVFDELEIVDLVSWTTMIVGYTQNGYPLEALNLFTDQRWATIVPNSITIASALSACGQLHNLSIGRLIHMCGIKLGVEDNNVVMNALVNMYAKCCAIKEAESVFCRISEKDLVTWNSMMAGYSQNSLGHDALLLFYQMRSEGYLPDAVTLVNALSASACISSLHVGCLFHAYAIKAAFLPNVYVSTALLNLYNKCGDLASASSIFDEMSNKNAITWCAMMGGFGMQGDSTSSLDLLQKMVKDDMKPNDVAFTNILSTCSHTGMLKEGKKQFEKMSRTYDIVPSTKHYACMVDMLARAGRFQDALEFINRMPVKAEISVWGALLHGCQLHSRLDLGEKTLRKMMELRLDTPDYYVLMSNLYASDGRWDKALEMRELMKLKGLIKLPGSSITQFSADG